MGTNLIDPNSLALTLDHINDLLLSGGTISTTTADSTALWIAERQGLPRSYSKMFAPTEQDFKTGVKLFTGENLKSVVSLSHILGEEACRVLLLLKSNNSVVQEALKRATAGMLGALDRQHEQDRDKMGTFCCGTCSPAYWRHLAAGGLRDNERELEAGLTTLKRHRLPDSDWRRFPFHWTVSALVEIGDRSRDELKFVAGKLERLARKNPGDDPYAKRRKLIAEKALNMI